MDPDRGAGIPGRGSTAVSPLAGVLVVALEQAVAGPLASRHLADLGARVIKIERPGVGDFARHIDHTVSGLSSHFVWVNRSKESLTLNLKEPSARSILDRLLARADVFIQNFSPGAIARLGLDPQTLQSRYPKLVICSISGYGQQGPYAHRKAYDLLIQAEAGLLSVTGTPDAICKAGIAVADIAAGVYAFANVLAALYVRMKTGQGSVINVSMLDTLAEWMEFPFYYAAYGGALPERTGAKHATIAPYGPFQTADGSTIMIAVENDGDWARFCQAVLERPDLVVSLRFNSNSNRLRHRDELESIINTILGRLSDAEVVARLERAEVAYGRVRDASELGEHPQLKSMGRWRAVDSPAGPIRALLPPLYVNPNAEDSLKPIPSVGEHTDAILRELGLSDNEICELRCRGAI